MTVTAAVPVEDSVIDCVFAVLTLTLPKLRLEELMPSVGTAALSCREKVWETVPALAVRVAACAVVTEATVAAKLALVAPAATVTEAGTVTDALVLARLTAKPPLVAAELSETVQASVPEPVIEALVQETAVNFGVAEFAAVNV